MHCRVSNTDQCFSIFLDVANLFCPDYDLISFLVKTTINLHLLQSPQLVIWILGITGIFHVGILLDWESCIFYHFWVTVRAEYRIVLITKHVDISEITMSDHNQWDKQWLYITVHLSRMLPQGLFHEHMKQLLVFRAFSISKSWVRHLILALITLSVKHVTPDTKNSSLKWFCLPFVIHSNPSKHVLKNISSKWICTEI